MSVPRLFASLALVLTAACAQPRGADASIQVFDDRGAWEAAVAPSGIVTEDFSPDDASDVLISSGIETSVGLFSVFYETANGGWNGWDLDVGDGHFDGSRHLDFRTDTGGADEILTAEWRFDDPVFAFGADFEDINTISEMEFNFVGTGEAVLLNDVLPGTDVKAGFLGVVLDASFRTISITAASTDQAAVDNVSFASAVPEATSLVVWCGVMATCALGVGRRRRVA